MTTNIFNAMSTVDIVKILYDKTGIKANVMISYPYLEGNASKATKVYRGIIGKLYLDSGAFSSFTGKFKVSRHEYALYLKRYGHLFDEYFNLDDKFDDAAHNLENQYYLEGELGDVRKPIPVIHDPENPFMELQVYAEMGHNYIALGSMGAQKRIDPAIMDQVRDKYPDLKIHLFGNLDRKILEQYRPYSADSSSWAQLSGKGGSIYYWRPNEKKSYIYYVGSKESDKNGPPHIKRSQFWDEIEDFLHKTFGYNYPELLDNAIAKQVVNLYFYRQYEDYLNSLDKE